MFAEVFQRQIAAQAESGDRHGFESPCLRGVVHDGRKVFGSAAVVEAGQAVEFAGTATEVPRQYRPTASARGPGQSCDVGAAGVAFQTVRNNEQPSLARVQPIQIQEIPVFQFKALAMPGQRRHPTGDGGKKGLQVGIPEPHQWAEG